jgi:hypothetical protein
LQFGISYVAVDAKIGTLSLQLTVQLGIFGTRQRAFSRQHRATVATPAAQHRATVGNTEQHFWHSGSGCDTETPAGDAASRDIVGGRLQVGSIFRSSLDKLGFNAVVSLRRFAF